jgi:hypothetical protein
VQRAPRHESTSGDGIGGTREVAAQDHPRAAALDLRVGHRHGRQERLGVGVLRVLEQVVDRADLDDSAQVHDGDPVGDVPHDGQVVRHEQVREPEPRLELVQEVDHPGLDGDVQRRDGLVEHHECRVGGEGAGDADALPLAAGERGGEAVAVLRVEPDERHQLVHAGVDRRPVRPVRRGERLGEDVGDGHAGVERAHRVLEHHLQRAAQLALLAAADPGHVDARDPDAPGLRRAQVHDLEQGGGLPAAGLTDEPERLARADVQVDLGHRPHLADPALQDRALAERERLADAAELEHVRALLPRHPGRPGGRLRRERVDVGAADPPVMDLVRADAGRAMGVLPAQVQERRFGLRARGDRHRAARPERTACRERDHRRRAARDRDQRAAARDVDARHGTEQADRVRHARFGVQPGRGRGLHGPAGVHHHHVVGGARHHAEVVRHEDQRGTGLGLREREDVEDLGLHGDVEGRGGLVGDDQAGVVGDRDGDHHPLAHPAGELVREGPRAFRGPGDADEVEQLHGPLPRGVAADVLVDLQGLDDLAAHGEDRRERGHRVLEDHADLAAADPRHLLVPEAEQLAAVERDGAGHGGVLRQQPHDRQRRDRLPGPRLAHDAERPSGVQVDVDAADGLHHARLRRERHPQVADRQDRGCHARPPDRDVGSSASRRPSPISAIETVRSVTSAAGT